MMHTQLACILVKDNIKLKIGLAYTLRNVGSRGEDNEKKYGNGENEMSVLLAILHIPKCVFLWISQSSSFIYVDYFFFFFMNH